MKNLLLATFAALSLNAYSQSYLIFDNGITITTDTSGFVYDFGHYAFPQKITLKGGQYFVEEGGILATIDENGLLFRKYEVIPERIRGKGMNYFLSDMGALYTVDKAGAVTITQSEELTRTVNFGGNYFTLGLDPENNLIEIVSIDNAGKMVRGPSQVFKAKDIVAFGGSYFMNNRGVVHTIAADGTVAPQDLMRVGLMGKRGGNYFTDSSNFLYTVAADGTLKSPGLPLNLRVANITKLGSNYFLDQAGRFYVVDKEGNVFERVMQDLDFRTARVISL